MTETFRDFLAEAAGKYDSATAMENYRVRNAVKYSYAELYGISLTLAEYFSRKVGKGKHISMISENSAEYIILFFAVQISGNVFIPLTDRYSDEEIRYIIEDSDTEYLIYSEKYSDLAGTFGDSVGLISIQEIFGHVNEPFSGISETDGAALSMIVYSSGTGGRMKGVMLTQKSILFSTYGLAGNCYTEGRTLLFLPMNHMYCWGGNVLLSLLNGTEIQIIGRMKALFSALTEINPECLFLVPMQLTLFRKMVQDQIAEQNLPPCGDLDIAKRRDYYREVCRFLGTNLKYIFTAGAPLSLSEAEFWHATGISVINIYGTTECSPFISSGNNDEYSGNSIGKCIPCCEYRLLHIENTDYSQLLVRGEHLMKGYYKNPEKTREVLRDGWYLTGDAAELRSGNLYITGRIKNIIVTSSGENISPEELEELLGGIEGIKEVMVYCENDMLSARICSEEGREETVRKEAELLNLTLPEYKRIVNFTVTKDALPKTSLNKIKRI